MNINITKVVGKKKYWKAVRQSSLCHWVRNKQTKILLPNSLICTYITYKYYLVRVIARFKVRHRSYLACKTRNQSEF